jgi:hypothetical protein
LAWVILTVFWLQAAAFLKAAKAAMDNPLVNAATGLGPHQLRAVEQLLSRGSNSLELYSATEDGDPDQAGLSSGEDEASLVHTFAALMPLTSPRGSFLGESGMPEDDMRPVVDHTAQASARHSPRAVRSQVIFGVGKWQTRASDTQ